MPIPKCGTNSLRVTFPEWAAEDHRSGEWTVPGFAIIRDPVERWFSGIAEATLHHDPDREYDLMLEVARNEGRFQWDNHTRPQSEFVRMFPDVELVKLDNAAAYILERFGRRLRWERSRKWEPAPDLYDAVREHYAEDVVLYERAL